LLKESRLAMTFARTTDPIVAIATASGRGAVGIVRVSGAGWRR
jgi:tRNA modification GTPase